MKVKAFLEKGGSKSFACRLDDVVADRLAIGYGSTAEEAMQDLNAAMAEFDEMDGRHDFADIELEYCFDVGSLFDYYDFIKIEGIAKLTGISASVLRQYASGVRTPRAERLEQIRLGLLEAAGQLNSVVLSA